MGRHSRRGPVRKGDATDTTAARDGRSGPDTVREDLREVPREDQGTPATVSAAGREAGAPTGTGPRRASGPHPGRRPGPAGGAPGYGVPRLPDGWAPQGAPARDVPRFSEGTPAHGVPGPPDGTPAHGVPPLRDGTPAHGTPRTRGGHPEQREAGGGWGEWKGQAEGGYGPPGGVAAAIPRQRQAPAGGPRQDYLDAFAEDDDVFAPRRTAVGTARTPRGAHPGDARASAADRNTAADRSAGTGTAAGAPVAGVPAPGRNGKGRTFTGIAAAAVTTVLAVVVAGQVADDRDGAAAQAQSAADRARGVRDSASRGDGREVPSAAPGAGTLTYAQKMDEKYPLSATLEGPGTFEAIPGIAKAPGRGQKFTYRVDVEQGLGLDGELFAEAVHKTLNDDRGWAHNGARTFERIHSGRPDFVITLASPGTTADWCARSGLDTTVDNVSCDSAATERVMINAYRWAQGSKTYGDQIHAYRQMLINHEVGHRLGYSHVTCDKDGDLAPVMQQQTKFLDHDGIHCRANPWPYPGR
ncbi:DUF3152 domain-containing protein [Streptomyces sp. NPDC052701]|uniref:DUF3152 domain-containing protein n=1 Tax=Streptomyces sp. NPDC052701 TaxID=3155533 RepID=UPI00342120C1